jgi:hypothetical protein
MSNIINVVNKPNIYLVGITLGTGDYFTHSGRYAEIGDLKQYRQSLLDDYHNGATYLTYIYSVDTLATIPRHYYTGPYLIQSVEDLEDNLDYLMGLGMVWGKYGSDFLLMESDENAEAWADATALRISDESPYDDDTKELLREVLSNALLNNPGQLMRLIGTEIIEENYFNE